MSLQSYYKMNTGWTDASGNGYDGTPNGAIINTVDQKLGAGCGEWDGLNDEVTFTSYYDPSGTSEFSIMGWINSEIIGASSNGIYGSASGGNSFYLQHNNVGEGLLLVIGATGGRAILDISTAWTHFAIVYNGTLSGNSNRLKIYENSVEKSSIYTGTIPANIPAGLIAPELGNIGGLPFRWYKGLLDNIEIDDQALTQAEIDADYNGGAGREIGAGGNIRKKRLMEMYNA